MKLKIVDLNQMSYEDLTNLHRDVRNSLKNVDEKLKPNLKSKINIVDAETRELYVLHKLLTKLRIQIKERILAFADTVNLS